MILTIPHWRRRIQRDLLTLLLDGPASVDRIDMADVPACLRRGVVGAAVADLRDAGLIVSTETYELSTRPWAHRNPKRRWELTDRPAARKWLCKHKPLTPPTPSPSLFGPETEALS